MPDTVLNLAQKRQIAQWLDCGYTDSQIVRRIDAQRERNFLLDDEPWPRVSRQLVYHYRRNRGEIGPASESGVSVASGTMLGDRGAHLRRLAAMAGDLEEVIEKAREQLLLEIGSGALLGEPRLKPRPRVIDLRQGLSGVELSPLDLGDVLLDEQPAVDNDRAGRTLALTAAYTRAVLAWEVVMRSAQKVSLLHSAATKDEAKRVEDAQTVASARELVELALRASRG